jgi:hypothetical protein
MTKPFDHLSSRFGPRPAVLAALAVVVGAAAPAKPEALSLQVGDASPFQQKVTAASPQATMQPAMYQPAPMPDPDASGPPGSTRPEAPSLMPTLLSQKREFEGDGFSYASSQQGALSHRSQPAAGLNLSVPVGQDVGHSNPTGD